MEGIIRIMCKHVRSASRSPVQGLYSPRKMSSSQLASALRPFYFAVHPDLFSGHPEMRRVNEQSLKTLNGYLDDLYRKNSRRTNNNEEMKGIKVQFYVRSVSESKSNQFRPVLINLGGESNPQAAIVHILESVHMDTKHIPPNRNATFNEHVCNVKFDDEKIRKFWESHFHRRPNDSMSLSGALEKHISQVERLQQTSANMRQHVESDINRLKSVAGVKSILWSPLWSINFCRGALRALDLLLKSYPQLVGALGRMNNVAIRFETGPSHLCVNGVLQLGVNDPPEYWLRVIQAGPATMASLRDIQNLHRKLVKWMGGVKLEVGGNTGAEEYEHWLNQLVTRFQLEHSHIDERVQYSGVIVRVQGPTTGLFVTNNGEVILPCTSPVKEVFQFLKEYSPIAKSRQNELAKLSNELLGASHVLMQRYKFSSITYESSIDVVDLLKVLEKIENIQDHNLIEKLKNVKKLHIAKQNFGVTHDGKFILPINFDEL